MLIHNTLGFDSLNSFNESQSLSLTKNTTQRPKQSELRKQETMPFGLNFMLNSLRGLEPSETQPPFLINRTTSFLNNLKDRIEVSGG